LFFGVSTIAEIENAIVQLPPGQQRALADWLNSRLMPETPALLAALDAGGHALASEPPVAVEEVRRQINGWASR
jgi:hypothetical protein